MVYEMLARQAVSGLSDAAATLFTPGSVAMRAVRASRYRSIASGLA
jgi:hypothetical protein